MIKTRLSSLLLTACVLALASCESAPTDSGSDRNAQVSADQPIRLTDVPPPPGVLPQAVQPLDSSARTNLNLEQILDTVQKPRYLTDSPDAAPESSDPADPPLAAQKFYAEGRQALLEGDNFRAVQQLEKALRLSPDQPHILRSLGQAWTRAGNRVSAANQFRRAFAADPTDFDSLFMLGRFASDERDWEQAILHLHAALDRVTGDELPPTSADPAAARLLRFYLANALNQAGYARPAVEMYQDYLAADAGNALASRYTRELMIIDAQQGETLAIVGDLHHRLDDPLAARDAYALAAQVGVLNPDALRRRLLYTYLRLGQTRAAEQLVAQAVAEGMGDQRALELIPYAAAQGVPITGLTERLTQQYQSQGRPAALALAMANVLPQADAVELLRRHLADQPGDDAVLGRLIELLVSPPAQPDATQQAITITAQAMAGSPALAELYAKQLTDHVEPPATLLNAFPSIDAQTPEVAAGQAAALQTLRGHILLLDENPTDAAQAFTKALKLNPDQPFARTTLASCAWPRAIPKPPPNCSNRWTMRSTADRFGYASKCCPRPAKPNKRWPCSTMCCNAYRRAAL